MLQEKVSSDFFPGWKDVFLSLCTRKEINFTKWNFDEYRVRIYDAVVYGYLLRCTITNDVKRGCGKLEVKFYFSYEIETLKLLDAGGTLP